MDTMFFDRAGALRACSLIVIASLAAASASGPWCHSTCGSAESVRAAESRCHAAARPDAPALESTDCRQHDLPAFTSESTVRPVQPLLTAPFSRWPDGAPVGAWMASVRGAGDRSAPHAPPRSVLRI
jgi:hypothetical protein